ncbi:DUF167 domain-containing protein [Candidatus Woesearchaeota archaeon]|nr:DUF167 domain-containing protein [Candidatus Woesearchaeota archaeon]
MIIKVKVKTNSKNNDIIKEDDFYKVNIKSQPENNKANIELIKLLTRYFKKKARIINGFKSREKLLSLEP